jgi:cyclic pyranopterin phosphate synthase
MPFAGNEWDKSKMVSQKEILHQVQHHFQESDVEKLEDDTNFTAREFKIKNYLGSFGIISSITNPFCDGCNRIRLTANGKIKNCLFSNSETDLVTPFRNGEAIEDLIAFAIKNKKKVRAGMTTIEDVNNPALNQDNRSMIAIGG